MPLVLRSLIDRRALLPDPLRDTIQVPRSAAKHKFLCFAQVRTWFGSRYPLILLKLQVKLLIAASCARILAARARRMVRCVDEAENQRDERCEPLLP
jgi:hypothetical protein